MFTKSATPVMTSIYALASLAGVAFATALTGTAFAETVKVTLSDKGAAADMPTGLGMEMPGADMSKATMTIAASPSTIEAGNVTFEVTNLSKELVHEMLVVPLGTDLKQLPYSKDNEMVDENTVGSLGEVEERDPGASGTLALDLKPGKYILFCNVPGHYTAGMWTMLTVVPTATLTQ